MNSRFTFRAFHVVILVGAQIASCGPQPLSHEHIVQVTTQPLNVSGGDVPLPVNPATNAVTWDATYADLLAADALTACYVGLPALGNKTRTEYGYLWPDNATFPEKDQYFAWLAGKMSGSLCPGANSLIYPGFTWPGGTAAYNSNWSAYDSIYRAWDYGRECNSTNCQDPSAAGATAQTCNIDAASGLPATRVLPVPPSTSLAAYLLPDTSVLATVSSVPFDVNGLGTNVWKRVRDEISYAPLNLCVVEQMREHLNSMQVAFASTEDVLRVHQIMRERAYAAVAQYSAIVRALDEWNNASDVFTIDGPLFYGPMFARWYLYMVQQGTLNANLAQIGQDYALAISRLTEITEEQTELLLRSPAGRSFGEYGVAGTLQDSGAAISALAGPAGARLEALGSYYGYVTPTGTGTPLHVVTTDMRAPEVGVLYGLARSADAFKISGKSDGINLKAEARNLFDAVENQERQNECLLQGSGQYCNAAVSPTSDLGTYLIGGRYGLHIEHAETLMTALVELVFGRPGYARGSPLNASDLSTDDAWVYPLGLRVPSNITARVSGTHTLTGSFATAQGGMLKLDPDFSVLNQASIWDARTQDSLVARVWDDRVHPALLGFSVRGQATVATAAYNGRPTSLLGTAPALVSAREVLTELRSPMSALQTAAAPALGVITAAIGDTSIIVRSVVNYVAYPAGVLSALPGLVFPCKAHAYSPPSGPGPATPACTVPQAAALLTNAKQLRYSVDVFSAQPVGVDRVRLDGYTAPLDGASAFVNNATLSKRTLFAQNGQEHWTGEVISFCGDTAPGTSCETDSTARLKLYTAASGADLADPFFDDALPIFSSSSIGLALSSGGVLGTQISRAWSSELGNWSKPEYDAFGLSAGNAPMGDASLFGGQPGEEAYQYFLRSADDAAREATTAIEKSFETLAAEATDELALTAADEKAEKLNELEQKAICGEDCAGLKPTSADMKIPSCSESLRSSKLGGLNVLLGTTAYDLCFDTRGLIKTALGTQTQSSTKSVRVSAAVKTELGAKTPKFDKYAGGQIQGQLVEQWNAWRALEGELQTAVKVAEASALNSQTVSIEDDAAEADYLAAQAEIEAQIASYAGTNTWLTAQRADFVQQRAELAAQYQNAKDDHVRFCSEDVKNAAVKSGYSYKKYKCTQVDSVAGLPGGDPINLFPGSDYENCGGSKETGWNSGPSDAAQDRCTEAETAWNRLKDSWKVVDEKGKKNDDSEPRQVKAAYIEALDAQIAANGGLSDALTKREAAATARRDAAISRTFSDSAERSTQLSQSLQSIQAAYGRVVASQAAIREATQRADLATQRIAFEKSQTTNDIKARFNLRRRFHSYDLWRARALAENARRLAVTARRAIENRFVVDMSTMSGPESFVEAPAIWADEIYESDLKPPSALGKTKAPASATTASTGLSDQLQTPLYSNKITDYVNNLGLFVKGYGIERPTAIVRSDTEAIQLPGPATTKREATASGLIFSMVDPESSGWSFYCPEHGAWLSHPSAAEFGIEDTSVEQACDGKPPTRARLTFVLDPWGRQFGSYNDPPYAARHNVRWRQLAVNLVGAGIRDCSKADDELACYAEPFIRFQLRHVGPAWVTNYEEQWRTLDLPIGVIEGGKALATEEWLDPVTNGFSSGTVANVARIEYAGRPIGGAYELLLDLTPDVRVERIERIQVLAQTDYWVREQRTDQPNPDDLVAQCGNGILEPGETCEGDCPGYCGSDGLACTSDVLKGSALLCTSLCVHDMITRCINADGCCAPGCTSTTDSDCRPPACGDGTVNGTEQCDVGAALVSTPTCDVNCTFASCGDGMTNTAAGEICDGLCPTNCSDGNVCTTDTTNGTVGACNVVCSHVAVTVCVDDDGCCPGTCNNNNDNDCPAVCTNGIKEAGETCDGADCPVVCNDMNACTADSTVGAAATCDKQCQYIQVTTCQGGDGCCAPGCNQVNDSDCPAVCGNGVIEVGEYCEGAACPTSCATDPDNDKCTASVFSGSGCQARCLDQVACTNGDQCCPFGCTSTTDNNCLPAATACSDVNDTLLNHYANSRATRTCTAATTPWSATFEGSTTLLNFLTSTTGTVAITTVCGATTTAGCTQAGTQSLRLTSGATIPTAYKDVNTSGLSGVTLSYYRRPYALEGGEPWIVDYSTDAGTTWTTLENLSNLPTGTATAYAQVTFNNLPSVPALRIRFQLSTTGTLDYVHLDTVTVTGTPCTYFAAGQPTTSLGTDYLAKNTLRTDLPGTGAWISGTCPKVDASGTHACAIQAGKLYCWGDNSSGQLGIGNTTPQFSPVQVGTASNWDRVVTSNGNTCGIAAGTLYCWGSNTFGQIGKNALGGADQTTPYQSGSYSSNETFTDWSEVTLGMGFVCAIRPTNTYCWGKNNYNQLGMPANYAQPAYPNLLPLPVGGPYTRIAAGDCHVCARTSGLSQFGCWGCNASGQIGDGTTATRILGYLIPGVVASTIVAAGSDHSCGVNTSGVAYCWGGNLTGALGIGNFTARLVPTAISGLTGWTKLSAKGKTTCGLINGSAYCWGANGSGQLGNGGTAVANYPQAISIYGDWGTIANGDLTSCGRRGGNSLFCWGADSIGQVGNGSASSANVLFPQNITPATW